MTKKTITFGSFLNQHRQGKMTLRAFAAKIGVTPAYISDIENGRRDPPGKELVDKMAAELSITGSDLFAFYDLAGYGRMEVSPDLREYIMDSKVAAVDRLALRTARDHDATKEDWQKFIEDVKRKESTDI